MINPNLRPTEELDKTFDELYRELQNYSSSPIEQQQSSIPQLASSCKLSSDNTRQYSNNAGNRYKYNYQIIISDVNECKSLTTINLDKSDDSKGNESIKYVDHSAQDCATTLTIDSLLCEHQQSSRIDPPLTSIRESVKCWEARRHSIGEIMSFTPNLCRRRISAIELESKSSLVQTMINQFEQTQFSNISESSSGYDKNSMSTISSKTFVQ